MVAFIASFLFFFGIAFNAQAVDSLKIAYSSVNPHALLVSMAEKREHFGNLPGQAYEYEYTTEDENGRPDITTVTHRWEDLTADAKSPLWTDDFSNLIQILNKDYMFKWKKD